MSKRIYKNPISVLLMSAFVCPGSGQFINGQFLKGLIVLLGTMASLLGAGIYVALFFVKTFSSVWDTVAPGSQSEFATPSISIPLIVGLVVVFTVFYIYGIIDSYLVSKKIWDSEKQQENN